MATDATFEIVDWDEQPVEEWDGGGKLSRARVRSRYTGGIEGDGTLEYLLAYQPDGTASFVGVERVTGAVGGRKGALVMQLVGTYAGGVARATVTVVGGSDELADASGSGEMVADPSGRVTLKLSYGE